MITLLLSLPFCQPIQIPGFSTPFGLMIAFLGLRMGFGHRIWLPKALLNKPIPKHILETIITRSLWLIRKLKKFSYPRMTALIIKPVNGLALCFMGFFLALPLPIPLTNLIAAWSIFFISLGIIEDDGVALCIGYIIALSAFFLLIYLFLMLIRM